MSSTSLHDITLISISSAKFTKNPFQDDKMSPLLGITPPTDIVAKQRPDGEFPISKGYNLLSVSRNGKGNATPWEVTQRSGEGRGGSENIKKCFLI